MNSHPYRQRFKGKEEIDYRFNLDIYWGMLKKYKWMFTGLLFFILVLEAMNTLEKYLFKIIVDKGTLFAAGNMSKTLFASAMIIVALSYGLIVLVRIGSRWMATFSINHLDSDLIMDLKRRFFNHIVHLSHNFHTTHKTGSLISRLNRGAASIERMTDLISMNVAPLIFQLIVVGIAFIYVEMTIAFVVLLTVIVFLLYSLIMQLAQQNSTMKAIFAEDIEKANIGDIFTNIDSI